MRAHIRHYPLLQEQPPRARGRGGGAGRGERSDQAAHRRPRPGERRAGPAHGPGRARDKEPGQQPGGRRPTGF